jgi:hypothetical protein
MYRGVGGAALNRGGSALVGIYGEDAFLFIGTQSNYESSCFEDRDYYEGEDH